MSKKYPFYQVDAFTRKKFAGNPAGVVLAADGLSEAQMQAIARELNNSETAFVLAPEADDHDVRVRFFTPTTEVPQLRSCDHRGSLCAGRRVRLTILQVKAKNRHRHPAG